MRVLLTGGAGLIGRAITTYLQDLGYELRIIDIADESPFPPSIYAKVDILDFDALRDQVRGCDAVVHMAALRSPYLGASQDVFRINTTGTFNVFEAAAQEGIKRVVQASSINAIGCAWNQGDFVPAYLPIDEEHPRLTEDAYSFSKQQIEDIGEYYWRRERIVSTALRFPGVLDGKNYRGEAWLQRRNAARATLDELMVMPDAKRAQAIADARRSVLAWRQTRPMEWPNTSAGVSSPETFESHLWRAYAFDRYNLWAWIDARDAAQSVEKSLRADFSGAHALFVNDAYNWLDYDSETLARVFFPDVERKHALIGSESLVSISRARELIGFEPQYFAHWEPTHD